MGAIACHKAQRVPFGYPPNPKNEPGAFAVFGLLITYLVVLMVGIIAELSIEKVESAMNVAVTAGFAVLCAAFWRSSDRNVTDAENGPPYRDLRHHGVSWLGDPDMMPNKGGSRSTDRWGPAPIIGFLYE